MTGKPLPFSHRFRSNSREHRNNSRHRNPNKFSQSHSKPIMGIVISKYRVETVHPTRGQISNQTQKILDHNHPIIIDTEIAHDDRFHEKDFEMLEITLIFFTKPRTIGQHHVQH